jgi:glycosyltransferase involved in cell wall biosynthesis
MAVFINPGGRIVQVDDPKLVLEHEANPAFKKLSEKEEKDWQEQRTAQIQEMKAQANMDESKGIYLATVSQGGKDGYGIASARLISELKATGIPVSLNYEGQKVGILFHNPYSILQIETPYRVIYTMFESDKIPNDWKDYLDAADLVIVPSKWCQEVFKKAGVETTVVPLGYDDKVFKYVERPIKRDIRQDFTFLHYNAFNIRKGFPEVFKAFTQEFAKDEPVKMIFKTTLNQIPLPITKAQYPNIEIITGSCSDQELMQICARSDAFVFPSRGEGFGMTPLETMATGLPAIVPNAHGHTEYFDANYMYEAKVAEMCPALYSRYKNQDVGKMVVCDIPELRKQMRWIYEHQKEAHEMGKKASEYVKQWTFVETARKLNEVLVDILKKPISEKPLRNVLKLDTV